MIIAVHQPNFLPWGGYFYKLLRSDVFIFFDDVQLPRGKSFCSRVKIKTPQGPSWLTVPVEGKSLLPNIADTRLVGSNSVWAKKHLGTLKAAYGRAPFYSRYIAGITELYNYPADYIADFNIRLISHLASILGAKTKFLRSSDIMAANSNTGDKILSLVKAAGGAKYISGLGAGTARYIEEQKFLDAGIEVIYYKYEDQPYSQLWGEFVPGLSIIDMLFNIGPDSSELLLSGGMEQ